MAADRRGRAAGFTLPLTMALAFSLMTLATAIVGMVLVSDKQAKASASDLVTSTTLESAIEQTLFGLERDGEPQAGEWSDRQQLNGLDVSLTLAPVRYKPDVNKDSATDLAAAIGDAGLRQRTVAALTPANPADRRASFDRFGDFVHALAADPGEEDCLRRRLSIGRKADVAETAPAATALIPPREPLAVGELIDVRAETRDAQGRREVLWRRVRYSGKPERAWLTHDWREMRLPRTDLDCPAPQAAPTLGGLRPKL